MGLHAISGWTLLAAAGAALASPALAAPTRAQYDFNGGWRLLVGDPAGAQQPGFDEAAWKAVTLPRAFNEDSAFAVDIKALPTGISWYRKTFILPPVPPDGKVFLEFEGVRFAGQVYVNGQLAYLSENGITAFGVDATRFLKAGENVVAVRADSSWKYREKATNSPFQWNNDNFNANYGGLNRGVRLHVTGGLRQTLPLLSSLGTTGVYVWADAFDVPRRTATVHAESQVRNGTGRRRTFRYRVTLRDAEGKPAGVIDGPLKTLAPGETATVATAGRLKGLNLWSWGYGYLYAVTTELVEDGLTVDAVTTRTGFRKTGFGQGMIRLNDRVMMVHGYAQRTTNEWPALGTDVPPWVSDLSNGLMVESGGNLVRWMHTTPSRQDVASADRVGLPQAMPAGDAESDVKGRRWEQRTAVMADAIVYFRNNPSILFYESGNENISEEHMAEMRAIRDRYDPHGGRAIGSREMLDSKVAEYGGEMLYINKSAGKPVWAMEYSRDEGARAFQDPFTPPFHQDAPAYNRNQDSHAVENVARWYDYWRERPGGGTRVSAGGVNIVFSDSNTHFRGDNNYRRSGEVDAMRLPKESFYVHRVMWDGWVTPEKERTHLIGHWTYAPGVVKDVQVVSTAEKVELLLNGRSLGFGARSNQFLFTFPRVAFAPGALEAVGYDAAGRRTSSARVETAGPAVALKLTPRTAPLGWRADGSDLALVDVEVVDARGRRVPTATDKVRFEVHGPAEWRGGIAQGDSLGRKSAPPAAEASKAPGVDQVTGLPGAARSDDNFILAKTLPVEGGINRVALRSTLAPGAIRVVAHAEGLPDVALDLVTVPPPPTDGAAPIHGDELPVRLDRGPTPAGPSYAVWRKSLTVVSATAGGNAGTVGASYDDNEASAWVSDGDLSKAWIEYDLGRPQAVGDVTLKLTGWRIRSYPLRVTLDGKTVWEGVPEKTLGYVTLPLRPATGRRLRIALTGPTEDRDGFGKIVEVKDARAGFDTGAEKVRTGTLLSIVETEIHGPIAK